ncbi:MAG: protein translocase subunit SecF, partial [Duodenibacillus sp.]|nr:protein translocase subunit SecF [Duodenibacillus sp.]
MELFRIRKTIPFMKYSIVLNSISFASFFLAVVFILWKGLAFSIEFTGGTQVVVQYPQAVETELIREDIKRDLGVEPIQTRLG